MKMKPGIVLLCGLMSLGMWGCGGDDSDSAGTRTTVVTGQGYGKECKDNVNCRTGLSCLEQPDETKQCLPAGTTVEGEPCTLTEECSEGLYCGVAKMCEPAGTSEPGQACASSADCAAGLVCGIQGFELICLEPGGLDVGEDCQFATDCMAGLGCVNASGQASGQEGATCVAGGETCTSAAQCGGRACLGGFCSIGADVPIPEIFPGVACDRSATDLRLFFDVPRTGVEQPEFFRLPFPNDARLVDGKLDLSGFPTPPLTGLSGPLVQRILDHATNELNGFGLNPTITFRFSSSIHLESLSSGGDPRFKLIDLTEWAANPTEAAPEIGVSWSAVSGNGSAGLYICDNWLAMRVPWGRALKPGHTYAAVVFAGVTGERGTAEISPDLTEVLASSTPSDPALSHAHGAYQPLRDFLASDAATNQGILTNELIGATVFTTQDHEKSIPLLRDVVRAEAAPTLDELTLCDGTNTSPCDDGLEGDEHTRGCFDVHPDYYELHARVTVPIFQEGTPPYFSEEDGGAFSVDANGTPVKVTEQGVCVSITIPKNRTMPAEGWPVVITAHGTGGNFRSQAAGDAAGQLSTLSSGGTDVGAITIGFEGVSHGERRLDSDKSPQTLFFNFTNPQAARGNVLQGVADIFQMVYLAENMALEADASPTLEAVSVDPAKIYLMAHSQGTTYGTIALPHEPVLDAAVLSGAGGGFMVSTLNKTKPVDIAGGIKIAFSAPNITQNHPVLNMAQMFIDAADAVNYAESVLIDPEASRCPGEPEPCNRPHVFHAFGVGDNYTPDKAQEALDVGLGVHLVEPPVAAFGGVIRTPLPVSGNYGGVTAFVRQYQPDQDYDGHFVLQRHPEAVDDLQQFFGSLLVDGVPTVD